ncbi:uncharacterized protein TM35_000302060 [Trypanosoma theileri]|uniref:Uncharacterized protein n=1 Tax=Trypanosoma theileri TaxID=67003 RepID=A0A1X0NN68_9TRYP|nr:uncharacterized protein TM35_000302060 [Trypanosoma theileri]ORC86166.1 hypothetical protein TM35_000302060 [Trypanosoma theileri]
MLLFTSAVVAVDVSVGYATCGTTIPIDSQWVTAPVWSLQKVSFGKLSRYNDIIETEMLLAKIPVSDAVANVLRSEAGMILNNIIVFELNPERYVISGCSFFWDPLKAGLDGVEATTARVLAFDSHSTTQSCSNTTGVEIITSSTSKSSQFIPIGTEGGVAHSLSFSTRKIKWPVTFRVPSKCTVRMLLLLDREGSIHHWYVWIPATAYTGVTVLLVIAITVYPRDISIGITTIVFFFIFLGYVGSCVGLVVEVVAWQSAIGRMFPFPNAVTLYCCLSVFYLILLTLPLIRRPHRGILFHAILRFAVYGANCALCCGYWIAGYIVLGSLALLQFVLSNLILTVTYSYFVQILERAGVCAEYLTTAVGLLWFAPITPFAPCVLMYSDLYIIEGNSRSNPHIASIVKEAVVLYNALTSSPFLFLQNIWGIALLVTATVYHMPFAILLFVLLLFAIVHVVLSVQEYIRAHRRWSRCVDLETVERMYSSPHRHNRSSSFCCCCSRWCFLWLSLEHVMRSARHRALIEEDNTRRCLMSVTELDNRPVRVSTDVAFNSCDETVMSSGTQFPSPDHNGNEQERTEGNAYWPTSVSM